MNKNARMPEISDYVAAVDLQNEAIHAMGGAWVKAMRMEADARYVWSVHERLQVASNLAYIVEELDDNNSAVDKTYRATHAFQHGMLNGFEIVELTHDDLIDHTGVVNGLGRLLVDQLGEKSEQSEWIEALMGFGERGLDHFDAHALSTIEQWAEEYTTRLHHQRLYKLGFGATILAGYTIHQGHIERQIAEATAAIDWSEILASDTGE